MAKTKRTEAQIEAEAAYAAKHEIIQINLKMKAKADVKMFKGLRKRFPGMKDSAIARLAVKELAEKTNK